jgi:hypothetical protein
MKIKKWVGLQRTVHNLAEHGQLIVDFDTEVCIAKANGWYPIGGVQEGASAHFDGKILHQTIGLSQMFEKEETDVKLPASDN